MEVFRLSRKKHSGSLSGKGAAIMGARWNSIGVELVYTSLNRSLAMAEVAVHFSLATMPDDYVIMTISIPEKISIEKINASDLPDDWNTFPHSTFTQAIGDKFVSENKNCLLQVPSAITSGDFNILINVKHPEFSKIKIVDVQAFPFDKRIFRYF